MTSWNESMTSWTESMTSWNESMTSWTESMTSWNESMTSWNESMTSWNESMTSWTESVGTQRLVGFHKIPTLRYRSQYTGLVNAVGASGSSAVNRSPTRRTMSQPFSPCTGTVSVAL